MANPWQNTEQVLQAFIDEKFLVGCGLQIYQNGEKIFDRCQGSSTADGKTPMTASTLLHLYSMTKNFTCAGAMTLYEKGLFDLDDPIAEYLPEFAHPAVCISDDIRDVVPAERPITIRQLFSMQSGLTYWTFPGLPHLGPVEEALTELVAEIGRKVQDGMPNTLEQFVKDIASMPLCFQPGDHWRYGLSLTVIGRLCEVLSGMTIGEFLRKTIWEPLGMTNSCFSTALKGDEAVAELMIDAACGVAAGKNPPKEAYPAGRTDVFGYRGSFLQGPDFGIELPCGGMISTMDDMSRLFAMFAGKGQLNDVRILKEETIDLMRTNQLSAHNLREFAQDANKGFGYGLGYRVFRDAEEAGFSLPKGSFGWDGAAGCYGIASPETGISFVFIEQSIPHHIVQTIPRIVRAVNADLRS